MKVGRAHWETGTRFRQKYATVDHDFLCTSSTSQRNSLRLLLEWWTGRYVRPEVATIYREAIRTKAAGNEFGSDVADGIPEECHSKTTTTVYFNYFVTNASIRERDLVEVQNQRNFAAWAAACQRIAFDESSTGLQRS